MQIETLILGAIEENCYVVYDENRVAAVIDPGDEPMEILSLIGKESLNVQGILLTHGHFDHIGAVSTLREKTAAPVYLHEQDQTLVENAQAQAAMFGLETPPGFKAEHYIKENDKIKMGDLEFSVLHTPGHSRGSVCFFINDALFAGDTLFQSGIGRTDLPGGSYQDILQSIEKIFNTYPGAVRVLSGHGPPTTLERERLQNPFLQNFT
ncbi:MAG: MBL fold metallo-hydrolase [candidate division KSB1 bacterium]|nr:MBL fold metallo-hydrolase [candidate division KSB1 bacterium]